MVFVDGQNVFKASERHFGRGQVHPILLARRLATGRRLVGTRYYSGIHDPHKRPDLHSTASRRHALMRRTHRRGTEAALPVGMGARSHPPRTYG